MRIIRYTVTADDAGRAVRSVVPRRFHLGTHAFRRLKALGAIRVGGQSVHADRVLSEGEEIEIWLDTDEGGASSAALEASGPASFIRHIDGDMIVVSKGAPLATLPSRYIRTGTLREQLAAMLGANAEAFAYHPVNRLDKGTSGLLCVARHAHAQRLLSAQLHTGGFVREYLAVTEGVPAIREGTIDAPIARLGTGARRGVREDGQRAVPRYRVIGASGKRALIRLPLDTGRTHQIRVHMAHIGCPIAGDYLYGTELPELGGRFALHSAYLCCTQPVTGETIELSEPLPPELAALLD